uniref:Uncharacterized protein n=2 Tax=Vombatus ursinus TaxID=29139 RepID=A0A4X2KGU2_VOMUR
MINCENPKEYPFPQFVATSKVQVLVLCTDGSLHLVKSERSKEPSISVIVERPVKHPNETICAVAPISSLPSMVLLFIWDGSVYLMDVTKSQIICELGLPPSYHLGNPWQPMFALSPEGHHVLIRGDKKDNTNYLRNNCSIFIFKFESYQLIKTFLSEDKSSHPGSSEISNFTQQLPLEKRCEIFLQNRLKNSSKTQHNAPEYLLQLQKSSLFLEKESHKKL